jgi:cytolysin-activating lysine-acyltransferase
MRANDDAASAGQGPVTISHLLGEMTWLLSQSPRHRALAVGDLEWLIMPPLVHQQFYVFRDGQRPVGLALWARCDRAAEAKLEKGLDEGRLSVEEWNCGDSLWLVELIAPFADDANRHCEIMFADLITGPLARQPFKFHETDVETGERRLRLTPADAGERLTRSLESALAAH